MSIRLKGACDNTWAVSKEPSWSRPNTVKPSSVLVLTKCMLECVSLLRHRHYESVIINKGLGFLSTVKANQRVSRLPLLLLPGSPECSDSNLSPLQH